MGNSNQDIKKAPLFCTQLRNQVTPTLAATTASPTGCFQHHADYKGKICPETSAIMSQSLANSLIVSLSRARYLALRFSADMGKLCECPGLSAEDKFLAGNLSSKSIEYFVQYTHDSKLATRLQFRRPSELSQEQLLG